MLSHRDEMSRLRAGGQKGCALMSNRRYWLHWAKYECRFEIRVNWHMNEGFAEIWPVLD